MDGGGRNNNNRGRGRGRGGGRGGYQGERGPYRPPMQNEWSNRPQFQNEWSNRPPTQNWPHRPPYQNQWVNQPPIQGHFPSRPVFQNVWTRPPVQQGPPTAATPTQSSPRPQQQPEPRPQQQPEPSQPSFDERNMSSLRISEEKPVSPSSGSDQSHHMSSLRISEEKPVSPSSGSDQSQIQPIKRPDNGGTLATRTIRLSVNHFPVKFDPNMTIIHYDVDVKPLSTNGSKPSNTKLRKSDLRLIKDKFYSDERHKSKFLDMTAYDGEKNIFSAVPLPQGKFTVNIPEGEETRSGSYEFTVKFVGEVKLSKLTDYMKGNLPYVPRDVLQSMDVVMKEHPSRLRISVGRGYYSSDYASDLHSGVAAYRGFQQSLKPTSRGLALCLDYSILSMRKPLPVIEYLMEAIPRFGGFGDVKRFKREVSQSLIGLKVTVTHRKTKQKYTIKGLDEKDARDSSFTLVDPDGQNPPREIGLVDYFREKWGTNIMHQDIPCLDFGKPGRPNLVPMEFCILAKGQRYPKEDLGRDAALFLKNLTLAKPWDRRRAINELVQAGDGPCGPETKKFGIGVDTRMTQVVGRVIGAPELKLGMPSCVRVDADKCQWNLLQKSFVEGKSMERWAVLDFTLGDRMQLHAEAFINSLMGRCKKLGMRVELPVAVQKARMKDLSYADSLEKVMKGIVDEGYKKCGAKLQIIVCVMTRKDPGYKTLKWISETKIGVITQCCLSLQANKAQDQYISNLCLKINAKLGGNNFHLLQKLPHFDGQDRVMFIGADVNHPGRADSSCPSIAAVVGTVNWPEANRYAARVGPQEHRKEKITNFGSMCLDLVNTYERLNKAKPNKIVIFRDGVSEGQFEMVLSEEMLDLKRTFHDNQYEPLITLVVVQKRHQTRLFVENRNDGGTSGNVPPGTVVDKDIVHPVDFDFYLCSHYGGLGTSKAAHYYVLWDENRFTSDELQKLTYDMCFTFARCTKPVSLVTPVYYADLVAYRGRMFQEVVIDMQQLPQSRRGPSSSSSAASSSSSAAASSNASFNQSFYNLHPDLENVMFFV